MDICRSSKKHNGIIGMHLHEYPYAMCQINMVKSGSRRRNTSADTPSVEATMKALDMSSTTTMTAWDMGTFQSEHVCTLSLSHFMESFASSTRERNRDSFLGGAHCQGTRSLTLTFWVVVL